ncbi:hypothetical protein CC86DRAFT_400684 [Ophiobolus disseminans]|uniref:Uncharacterized protein n=1 Tax=Ophiobolus disseminans TaxID=1469910 RepID=A0A6A7AGV3_9PLEO|nr:hypothetical protein CC86DRAFT_400684 [Ophiobolus disseminans]
MLSLILFLQVLDFLELVLEMLWLLFVCHDILWHQGNPLRAAFNYAVRPLFNAIGLRTPPPSGFEIGAKCPPISLNSPAYALHNLAWAILRRHIALLPPPDRAAFAPFLRGARFARLADSLLYNTPSPILAKYGITLNAEQLERVARIASHPELIVTPPEDGNRRAERGEKGGLRLRIDEGLLAPPRKVSRASQEAREKRRVERAKRAGRILRMKALVEQKRLARSRAAEQAGGPR